MIENIKNKIINIDECHDEAIEKSFGEFKELIESHNIDWNKFIDLIESIEVDNPSYYNTCLGLVRLTFKNGMKGHFNGFYMNLNIKESYIDSYNYVHELFNDGVVEKYYEVKWLKNTKKIVDLIEHNACRFHGFDERANSDEVVKNNELLKYIDNTLGEIVEKCNLDKEFCKNKFMIKNNRCFTNSKHETTINLKLNDNRTLVVIFKFDRHQYKYIDVTSHFEVVNKI